MDLSEVIDNYDYLKNGPFEQYLFDTNRQFNKNVLNELQLTKKKINEILEKLKNYKYVEEVDNLKCGAFIRWISLNDDMNKIKLHNPVIICEIKFTDIGTILLCKNFINHHRTIKLDECLIFQKFTDDEIIMINIVDKMYQK